MTPAKAGRREWIALGVLALPTLLVSIDVYVLLLALPHLSADLGANGVQQLWITDIYGFLLAGLLITMGTLGDRIGRRRLLLIGAAFFGVASIAAAYATSPGMLIGARAVLGIAGAVLGPSTMSLIRTLFPDPKQMGLALGIWGMCFSAGAIIGPLVGGAMLARFWWGSVFLLGVPAMVLLLILGPILLPEFRDKSAGRLDPVSVGMSLLAILPTIYGLKELAKNGWQPVPIAGVVVGLVFGFLFARRQRRLEHPLLDLRLFASRTFSTALGGSLAATLLMGALMYFITQDLQLVEGLTSFNAGLWMMPAIICNAVSFVVAPMFARKYRPAFVIGAGLIISISGLVVMTGVDTTSGPLTLAIGFALLFLGSGPLVTLGVQLVMGSAPPEKAGAAAALNETGGQFGFAFGMAAFGSLAAAVYSSRMGGGDFVETMTTPGVAKDVIADAREAFVSGFHLIMWICVVVLALVAILIVRLMRNVPPTGAAQQAPEAEVEPVPAG